jgi:putative ABC transport system substrate-binding protein
MKKAVAVKSLSFFLNAWFPGRRAGVLLVALLLVCHAFLLPAAAGPPAGKPAAGLYKVGVIALSRPFLRVFAGFWQGLNEAGYHSGFDVTFSLHDLNKDRRLIPALVQRFAREKYDLILTMTTPVTKGVLAARQTAGTVPVLFTCVADPLGSGLVKSLRQPGGAVTGISHISFQLQAKRLHLFAEAFPAMRKVAVFYNPGADFTRGKMFPVLEPVARLLGLDIVRIAVGDHQQLQSACRELSRATADGIFMVPDPLPVSNFNLLVAASRRLRLPLMVIDNTLIARGGVMGYSPDFYEVGRQAAAVADHVFQGVDAGRLPVQNPDQVKLVVSLKEAEKLHLAVDRKILLLADRIIR